MRKTLSILLGLLFLLAIHCDAYQNETNGFRELWWGEPFEEVEQKRTVEYAGSAQLGNNVYSMYFADFIEGESRLLSGVPIESDGFSVFFFNNKLWAIKLSFMEDPNDSWNSAFVRLREAMIKLYGNPTYVDNMETVSSCEWIGETTRMVLSRVITVDKTRSWCTLDMYSEEIYEKTHSPAKVDGW